MEATFGPEARPRVAWQIDPFGHSNTQAALFAAMGFDGLFFGRQDYDDHARRINESRLQMMWQPSESLGASADLFTGVMYNGYGQPDGFCFDTVCQNDFIQVCCDKLHRNSIFVPCQFSCQGMKINLMFCVVFCFEEEVK